MKGRRPAPTVMKLVKSVRKSRINSREAQAPAGMPLPPPYLSPEALAEWNRVVPAAWRAGLVTEFDTAAAAAYCVAISTWAAATKEFEAAGSKLVVPSAHRGVIANPLLAVIRRAMADAVKFGAECGLTPSGRSRIPAKPPEADDDPASLYLD